jgi:uncharacterized protein YqjF (DUF2071 family)
MHPALRETSHRPWPIPPGPWTWRQSWCDLLFAHWPVPASSLRAFVPQPLCVQEYGGTAWLGIVPFEMRGVARRPLPDMPWISAFPELNVRTYVSHDGKPGVWFLSLDATNPLAVVAARRWFDLPYHRASIEVSTTGDDSFHYRLHRRGSNVAFEGTYRPVGEPRHAAPNSLEHFLTERYCLYAHGRMGLTRVDVHHAPWPLRDAIATVRVNTLLDPYEINLDGVPPKLHFAHRVDAIIWPRAQLVDSFDSEAAII